MSDYDAAYPQIECDFCREKSDDGVTTMSDYDAAYPPIECDFCREKSDDVVVYHQRTQYIDPESNYVAACPECKKRNDEYWGDMWAEYYSGCM